MLQRLKEFFAWTDPCLSPPEPSSSTTQYPHTLNQGMATMLGQVRAAAHGTEADQVSTWEQSHSHSSTGTQLGKQLIRNQLKYTNVCMYMCLLVIGKQRRVLAGGGRTGNCNCHCHCHCSCQLRLLTGCQQPAGQPTIGCGMQTAASREPVFATATAPATPPYPCPYPQTLFFTFGLILKPIYSQKSNL